MMRNPGIDEDERLRALLREWHMDDPLPPRFEADVWDRIARAQVPAERGVRLSFRLWVERILPRPGMAFVYLAALLVLGIAGGTLTAQIKAGHVEASLSARYLRSVDPYSAEAPWP